MSAHVTYNVSPFDANGEALAVFPVRAVCAPTLDQALGLAVERDDRSAAVEVVRSIPAKIGHHTPATRRVSARVRILV